MILTTFYEQHCNMVSVLWCHVLHSYYVHAVENWTKSLDDGNDVDIVYLDFCKAFDCVPHQRILFKLKAYDISGNVLN